MEIMKVKITNEKSPLYLTSVSFIADSIDLSQGVLQYSGLKMVTEVPFKITATNFAGTHQLDENDALIITLNSYLRNDITDYDFEYINDEIKKLNKKSLVSIKEEYVDKELKQFDDDGTLDTYNLICASNNNLYYTAEDEDKCLCLYRNMSIATNYSFFFMNGLLTDFENNEVIYQTSELDSLCPDF